MSFPNDDRTRLLLLAAALIGFCGCAAFDKGYYAYPGANSPYGGYEDNQQPSYAPSPYSTQPSPYGYSQPPYRSRDRYIESIQQGNEWLNNSDGLELAR